MRDEVLQAEFRPLVRVNRKGALCIVDSNAPENEIRIRADPGDLADNFIVRTYGGGGRRAAHYTSGCTPAFF